MTNTTEPIGTFPFGEPIYRVEQTDESSKKVFVLGVYASAVHAQWRSREGKLITQSVAVASEPEIFWTGERAAEIVGRIEVPTYAGTLVPASSNLNGPTGRSLDEHFLRPLKLHRDDTWLCDLRPHSRMNPGQESLVKERYNPMAKRYGLKEVRWPRASTKMISETRCDEISKQIGKSSASILITLGDEPLRQFASKFGAHKQLREYGQDIRTYGHFHPITIDGLALKLLPLVHPRQAARLGRHRKDWADLHARWIDKRALEVRKAI